MHTLVIRHIGGSDPPQFMIMRLRDGKSTDGAVILSPAVYPVEGFPNSNLLRELGWYQEQFLDYPFPPETDHAEHVLSALRKWGEEVFDSLFGSMQGRDWFNEATHNGHDKLHLQVSSDDPRILCWPWEAIRDRQTDCLGLFCPIERKINQIADPLPLPEKLPKDRINILLITARPYDNDVGFRSISRILVELIESRHLPARVTLLRPPTFSKLLTHLWENPHTYHILHFDGHGSYGSPAEPTPSRHNFKSLEGKLVFEGDDGLADFVLPDQLAALLREHRIPAVVLNACQSAMVDDQADSVFASVAASLLKAGVRCVVAMAYSLYVSGAQQFLSAFYRRLFDTGSIPEAVRVGRQQMFQNANRVCARGTYPLRDWLVPVVYAQDELDFSFTTKAVPPAASAINNVNLPTEAQDNQNPYGFIGRDSALLALERAMRRSAAGVLINGVAGSGKTTLAQGFLQWRQKTGAGEKGYYWFSFNQIFSAEFIFNRLGEAIVGENFNSIPLAQKVEDLSKLLKEHSLLIVWDNFDSVRGLEGTKRVGNLSFEDQLLLKRFLEELRGGASKILITSRGEEDWLGAANLYKVPLRGLQGEERWELCRIILNDLGKKIDRTDTQLVQLMDALDGHPLMMRIVLQLLEKKTPGFLLNALKKGLSDISIVGDASSDKLQSALRLAIKSVPRDLRPLLIPLSLNERFIFRDALAQIAYQEDNKYWTSIKIDSFFRIMKVAGLVQEMSEGVFELHPAISSFLRSTHKNTEEMMAWTWNFVAAFAVFFKSLANLPFHDQRPYFY
jgi:hypothetical protein